MAKKNIQTEQQNLDTRVIKDATSVKYGMGELGVEVRELLAKRELYVQSGNPTESVDVELEEKSKDLMFNPRKSLRLSYLDKKNITKMSKEEKEEFESLIEEMTEFRKNSMFNSYSKDIVELIGSGKMLKYAKIIKSVKQGQFTKNQDMTWVPTNMKTFALNPLGLTTSEIPVSICKARVSLGESVEIKKPILKLEFVSVVFDDYTGALNSHLWTVMYDIEDANTIEFESDMDEDKLM